jgi:hypothetical protein
MIGDTLENLSLLLNIDSSIIPNIFTLIILVIVLGLTLKSQLNILTIIPIYLIISGILALLGVESVFNLFTL